MTTIDVYPRGILPLVSIAYQLQLEQSTMSGVRNLTLPLGFLMAVVSLLAAYIMCYGTFMMFEL